MPMLTDDEIEPILAALPPDSFLAHYCSWARTVTDGPLSLHLGVGLGTLASLAPASLIIKAKQRTYATLFVLLVGTSGDSRKTTAISLGQRLLEEVAPERILPEPESEQALIEMLASSGGCGSIWRGEMGAFLRKTHENRAFGQLREAEMKGWDCLPLSKKNAHKDAQLVEDPRLSMVGGVAPGYLTDYTDRSTWEDGYLSRFLVLSGKRSRFLSDVFDAAEAANSRQWLVNRLAGLHAASNISPCIGMTAAAIEVWRPFVIGVGDPKKGLQSGDVLLSMRSRVPSVAMKAALLLAYDDGQAFSPGWRLDVGYVRAGIEIAKLHAASFQWLLDTIPTSPWAAKRSQVLRVLGELPMNLEEILRAIQYKQSDRECALVIGSLLTEGAIHGWRMPNESGPTAWATVAQPIGG